MDLGLAGIAGMLVREVVQMVVEWREWEDSRGVKVVLSVVGAVAAAWGLAEVFGTVAFDEALVLEVWAAATLWHFAKTRIVSPLARKPKAS